MFDADVHRLRRLRNTALRARAIARALNADRPHADSAFARGAGICWRIARLSTDSLRTHTYRSYQSGPGSLRLLSDRLIATSLGRLVRHRGRSLRIHFGQLRQVAHQLDDARALTRSRELSESLDRSQVQIHDLMDELRTAIRMAAGSRAVASPRKDVTVGAHSAAAGAKAVWPYMAF